MVRKKCLGVFLVLLVLLSGIGIQYVQAQQQQFSLTISPAEIELSEQPGAKVTEKFRIRNDSSQPLPLQLSIEKLGVTSTGQVSPEKPRQGDDSISWFTFTKTTFTAQPQEWSDVGFTVTIPPDAAFGYYFVINITHVDTQLSTNNNAKVLGNVALPVLLEVKKDGAIKEGKLTKFNTANSVFEYLPVTFNTTIQATGNVHIKPQGNIFISDGTNQVASLDVNPDVGAVLPGQSRVFSTLWDDGFITQEPLLASDGSKMLDKNGSPETTLKINWNKVTNFRVGKYTAHLLIAYDNGTRDVTLEGTTTFWVISYKVLIGIGIAGILIVLGIFMVLSKCIRILKRIFTHA